MTYPTPEEIKQIAIECGARKLLVGFNREYVATCFELEELQAFFLRGIEIGRKMSSEELILARFYAVSDLHELVAAQSEHIERLQAKTPPLNVKFNRPPREG